MINKNKETKETPPTKREILETFTKDLAANTLIMLASIPVEDGQTQTLISIQGKATEVGFLIYQAIERDPHLLAIFESAITLVKIEKKIGKTDDLSELLKSFLDRQKN